jgi:iron complex outermembrane receptor protein
LFPLAPANSPTFDYNIIDKIWDFSTEFRLSSNEQQALRWTFGTNYVETSDQTDLWFYTSPTGVIPANTLKAKTTNYAKAIGFFGGLYYDPIKDVTLSAELRRQSDKRENVVPATGQVLSQTFDSWSPRLSVQYRFTPDVNVYASYAAGVRPGGFNAGIFGLPDALKAQIAAQVGTAPTAIDEEKLWTGEVGLKGSFLDHTVDTNVSVYYGKLTQQQVAQTAILQIPDPIFGGRFDLVTNNGNVDLSGIEADARWKLSRVVTLTGTFGYNKTKEHIANCFSCKLITGSAVLDGQRLNDSPETTATLSLDATDALTASADWFLHLDYVYKGSVYAQQNGLNLVETGAANLVNAQIGINSNGYAFALWATNLTDDKTYTGAQLSADFLTGSPYSLRVGLPDRRAFGLRVKYEFK